MFCLSNDLLIELREHDTESYLKNITKYMIPFMTVKKIKNVTDQFIDGVKKYEQDS